MQNKKAIVVFVPPPQLRAYQKIQTRLVRELEKKFSGKHVVIIAQVCCHSSGMLSLLRYVVIAQGCAMKDRVSCSIPQDSVLGPFKFIA